MTVFDKDSIVTHKKGGIYLIIASPDGRMLEYNQEEFYEYKCFDTDKVWLRCRSEMEDGRFELANCLPHLKE